MNRPIQRTIRRFPIGLCLLWITCATAPPPLTTPDKPFNPEWGETIIIDHLLFIIDSSLSMVQSGHFQFAQTWLESIIALLPPGRFDAGLINYGNFTSETFSLRPFDREQLTACVKGINRLNGNSLMQIGLQDAKSLLTRKKGRTAVILLSDGRVTNSEDSLRTAQELLQIHKDSLDLHTVLLGHGESGEKFLRQLADLCTNGSAHSAESVTTPSSMRDWIRTVMMGPAVTFSLGSASLRPMVYPTLDRIVSVLKRNPSYKLYIDGHSDSSGSGPANHTIAEARAKAVKTYLVKKGIKSNRLIVRGFGETQPFRPNTTEENRALNRRVEFTLIR